MKQISSIILLVLIGLSTVFAGPYDGLIKKAGDKKSFPGSNVLVVFDSTRVEMMETGLSHNYIHRLYKVLTPEGAKGLSVIKFDYDPLSAWSEIRGVTIYRADGSQTVLDTSLVLDYPQPARAIYWGAREKMIEVGRLEPGDAVEVSLYRKGFTYALLGGGDDDERYIPPMKGHFYDIVPFYGNDPVLLKVYQINVPDTKVLQYEVYNGEVSSKMWRKGDRFIYTFSKKDISPFRGEPRSVDASDVATKLLMSTSPDWKSKSTWFYGVNEDYKSFEANDEIRKKVNELLRNARTELDSVTILTHWAGDEIRYLGVSMGKGEGYTLHNGEMNFTDRCGVCKDKAGMLITMLRAAGFEAYPAMTMAGSRIDYIPADQFNHCVTVVKSRKDGKYHLLDPTWVPFVRELWSSAEQQQNYLMGVPEGADLAETPVSNPANHYLRMTGITNIASDGTLEGEYDVMAEGQTDAAIRGMFTRAYMADWAANVEKEVLRISPLAQLVKVTYDDPYNYLAGPIQMHFRIRIPEYATVAGDELIFTPLLATGFMKRAMPHMGFDTGLEERKFPFRDRTSHNVEITEKISLPGIKELVYVPDPESGDGSGAQYYGIIKRENNTLKFAFNSTFPKRIYQPEDWASFRKAVAFQNMLVSEPVIVRVK
jgi:transglutaminase-like putative cysteine protease